MGTGHNFLKFQNAISALSCSKDWDEAKAEWHLHSVYIDGSDRQCECGHQPIHQICVIENKENGRLCEVGNVCVHNFLKLVSSRIFAVFRRVREDVARSLNPTALDLLARRKVISLAEADEYKDYWRKRSRLTLPQRVQKDDVNRRALSWAADEQARLLERAKFMGLKLRTKAA